MRNPRFLRGAVLLAATISPIVAMAQAGQFQQPTQDELKMTADPKAPGAAAAYLNIEENYDDNLGSRNYYARIKVLTEKGKDLATVEVPYAGDYKVSSIKGRTIHSDGTIIPLEVKAEDLLYAKEGDIKYARKVFTLPNVEPGSIIEYRYDIDYPEGSVSSPTWRVQQPYFVHKAHYAFTPFKAFLSGSQNATSREIIDSKGNSLNTLLWWGRLPAGQKMTTDAIGRYSMDLTDVPAQPDEDNMPPLDSVLYRVFFYYKDASNAKDYWDRQAKDWSKDVNHFAEVSGTIKSAVAELIAPTDAELVKAKKLYDAVQALDNTDYSRKKTETEMKTLGIKEAKRAEDTWGQKSGSSEDIAMLYLAMLRAAGLTAYAMKVVDRSHALFDQTYLYSDQFDDTLVILSSGGREIMLDPGEKMCPFMLVNWRHSVAGGERQMPNGAGYVQTPDEDYKTNMLLRVGDVTFDDHGSISGNVTYTMTGQLALEWRQAALRNDETELKKQFDHQLEGELPAGVEGHLDHFLGLDAPDSNLLAVVNVSGAMGAATAKRLLVPGFFFESRGKEPFVNEEKRQEPVDMHYPARITDQITYHMPAGMTVEGAPADASVSWVDHALYIVKTKSSPGSIVVARSVANAFTMAKPEEYQDLRGFYQKVASGDQQQIVLLAGAADKGQ